MTHARRCFTLALLVAAAVPGCVDSELTGRPGDLPISGDLIDDIIEDVIVNWDGDTITTDIGCTTDALCVEALGPGPCERAFCDELTRTCVGTRVADCCADEGDCPVSDDPCVTFTCPTPGEQCVAVDRCPPCNFDGDCAPTAPPCTNGRCSEGQCFYEELDNCCVTGADCGDADSCTEDRCDGGRCVYGEIGGPGCCTVAPVIATSFSPAPPFEMRSNVPDFGWWVIETDLAPSPPHAFYMGNPDTLSTTSAAIPDGLEAVAIFRLGNVRAGSEVEVKFQRYVDLRAGEDVDRFRVTLAIGGVPQTIHDKLDAPMGAWEPFKITARADVSGPATLRFRYDQGRGADGERHLGILIDDLQVRTGCGGDDRCSNHAQCATDEPCVEGRCLPNGTCGYEQVPGCCSSARDCPGSPDPCVDVACDNGQCVRRELEECCRSSDDCGPSPEPCFLDWACLQGRCELFPSPVPCDDDDPCTEDFCAADGQCFHQPIPGCCIGPDCGGCEPDVASWDFETSAGGWQFEAPRQGFGWRRVQLAIPSQPRVLYFGSPDGPAADPGFPMNSYADSPPLSLPADAEAIQLTMELYIGIDAGQIEDIIGLVAVTPDGQERTLWQLAADSPRYQPIDFATEALTEFLGQTITLRWVYRASDNVQAEGFGFLVDDMVVVARCDPTTRCERAADCPLGPACTVRFCQAGVCQLTERRCVDDDPCTEDFCDPQRDECVFFPLPDLCQCDSDDRCDDGDPCTRDACEGGVCRNVFEPGAPGCRECQVNQDCRDFDPCTRDICGADGVCRYEFDPDQPNCAVCRDDAQCQDGNPCTEDWCGEDGVCQSRSLPGCCEFSDDCVDDNPCTQDVCIAPIGACVHPQIPGCCTTARDCDDDDACTLDSCDAATGTCVNERLDIDACQQNCNVISCNDGDRCTADSCDATTGQCVFRPIPNCCTGPGQCSDGDPCTFDTCQDGQCLYVPLPIPGCTDECESDADCEDDNPCTRTWCGANGTCQTDVDFGCCDDNQDCADDNRCTQAVCLQQIGVCVNPPVNCDDFDACTADSCDPATGCQHERKSGCCTSAAQCDDSNACTFDGCVNGACVHVPTDGCCTSDDDCFQAGCGQGRCEDSGTCRFDNCCAVGPTGQICDDGDPCTDDACDAQGLCINQRRPGCCTSDQQCPPPDACSKSYCDPSANLCVTETDPGCCQPTTAARWDFEDATLSGWSITPAQAADAVTWWVSPRRHFTGSAALYMGNPTTGDYDNGGVPVATATSPRVVLPSTVAVELRFALWLDVETAATFDPFVVQLVTPSGVVEVWNKSAVPESQYARWTQVRINLTAYAGQEVRLRFHFAADDQFLNDTEGIYIDDLRVEGLCEGGTGCGSDFECDDGDGCTTNRCVGQLCQFAPIPGCCRGDSECDDNYACTKDSCVNGSCGNELIAGCCTIDAECDDNRPCTEDRCNVATNTCRFIDTNGDCCEGDDDCNDFDRCTIDTCRDNGTCRFRPAVGVPECCEEGTWFEEHFASFALTTFNVQTDGSPVRWQAYNGQVFSPPFALYYGDPSTDSYDSGARTFGTATSRPIAVPAGAHQTRLAFNAWLDVGSFFLEDLLSVRVLVGQNAFTVWERTEVEIYEEWFPVQVDLPTAVAGRNIRIQFAFDSVDEIDNVGEGIYIDDIVLFSVCEP